MDGVLVVVASEVWVVLDVSPWDALELASTCLTTRQQSFAMWPGFPHVKQVFIGLSFVFPFPSDF